MKQLLFLSLFALIIFSCENKQPLTAQDIVDQSIKNSGLHLLSNSSLSFDFRDYHYTATRKNGVFNYTRSFVQGDSLKIKDELSNDGFKRFIEGELTTVIDSMVIKYSESVNSVHYFSILPLGLNDKAVIKKYLGEITIKGKEYHKVQISFQQEGGGVDFEDVFVYWFRKSDFLIDYLAYSYHTNGGGVRFREVSKEQIVKNVRFLNYINYKPLNENSDVKTLDSLFLKGQLKELSQINLEDIQLEFYD